MATLRLDVVTPERTLLSEDVEMIIAPGAAGELGVLPRHIPLITTLKPGEMRAHRPGGDDVLLAISGGFMDVRPDRVIVLADTAEHAHEIDITRAEAARARAEATIQQKSSDREFVAAQAALLRAHTRIRVAERVRTRRGQSR